MLGPDPGPRGLKRTTGWSCSCHAGRREGSRNDIHRPGHPDEVEGGAVEGEDDIPEPPVTQVSVAGDLWQLGSHRLICGDSTSANVVGRLMGDITRC